MGGEPGIWAIAGDTDGIDATEDAAGALITPDSLARTRPAGMDPAGTMRTHNSYALLERIGDLVLPGPTLTNVNDFRAIRVA